VSATHPICKTSRQEFRVVDKNFGCARLIRRFPSLPALVYERKKRKNFTSRKVTSCFSDSRIKSQC
jgi:hypothetical protein